MKRKLLFVLGLSLIALVLSYYVPTHLTIYADDAQTNINTNDNDGDGYHDPDDVTPDTTVHVKTANEFLDAVYRSGNKTTFKSGDASLGAGDSQIHKIILDNDINMSTAHGDSVKGLSYSIFGHNYDFGHGADPTFETVYTKHKNLVIDGQGHTLDMMFNTMFIYNDQENWTLENMKVLGSSYWGVMGIPLKFTGSNTLNYRNIEYYGSQLSWDSYNYSKTNIYGNVSVHSLMTYIPEGPIDKGTSGWNGTSCRCEYLNNPGDQQNLQTGDIEFHRNSHYFGETYNSNVLQLTGSIKIDDGAQIGLHPHGQAPETDFSSRPYFNGTPTGSVGLLLIPRTGLIGANSTVLALGSNVQFNIYCNNDYLTDNKGNSVAPSPNIVTSTQDSPTISQALYAEKGTNIQFNGQNAHMNIYGKGQVLNNMPLVLLDSMNANVSNEGNEFSVQEDADGRYIPKLGLLNTNQSDINVTNGGTFNMIVKNIPDSNQDNYQLVSTNSLINIDRPKEVKLSNDTFKLSQHNHLNLMSGSPKLPITSQPLGVFGLHNRILAQNVSVTAKLYDSDYNHPKLEIDNSLAKYIQLPLVGDRLLTPAIRLRGSYFNLIPFANGLKASVTADSLHTANNFHYVDFKGSPIPQLSSLNTTEVSLDNNEVRGKVLDKNGNPIANAYVKIKVDGSDNFIRAGNTDKEASDFYRGNDNYKSYINSQEILFSSLKHYQVTSNILDTTSRPFKSVLSNSSDTNAFKWSQGYFFNNYNTGDYKDFNDDSTLYDENQKPYDMDPYVAISNSKGDFSFKVPDQLMENKKQTNYKLDVVPSYNFTDGNESQLTIDTDNPKVSFINNTISDLSYPKSDALDGHHLSQVFQGGQGHVPQGDTLQYHTELRVTNTKHSITGTYSQPIPNMMDTSSLQISYDNGKNFQSLKGAKITANSDGTKSIEIPNIKDNTGKITLDVRGTLRNNANNVDNKSITFTPTFTYADNHMVKGQTNMISFTDNNFSFTPHSLDYGTYNVTPNYNHPWIYPVNYDQPLITDIHDNRRDQRSNVGISAQQISNKFVNNKDKQQTLTGHLIYNNQSLLQPVQVFSTNSNHNLYLNRKNPIYLSIDPASSNSVGGEYNTQLQWTVNYGIN